MSLKDGKDYLYLIWKCETTRRQYIVGQLSRNGQYEFQYCGEVEEAMNAGFKPLISFENINETYIGKELFPAFSSRLPDRKRRDIDKILKKYGLTEYDSYEFLKRSGARLPIDNLQFIDPILDLKEAFERKFYVAGARHYLGCEGKFCEKSIRLTRGDEVFLKQEKDNVYDPNAIRVQDEHNNLLGYIPRYYSQAFIRFMNEKRIQKSYVVRVGNENKCDECIEIVVNVEASNEYKNAL